MRRALPFFILASFLASMPATSAEPVEDSLLVLQPQSLPAKIPVERSAIGVDDDYKPCVVRLTSGELLVVAFHQHKLEGKQVREDMLMFRSTDNGKTWSDAVTPDLLGREPYFSQLEDGTLFLTVHLLEQDVRNELGYTHSLVHRSIDQGKTWETIRITTDDIPGAPPKTWILTSRNIIELEDGTLILGVSAPGGLDYLWRSRDRGQTWDKTLASEFDRVDKSKVWWPFHAETVFWQPRNGDILALVRVDPRVFPALPGTTIPKEAGDQVERLMLFRSADGGARWKLVENIGTYGEMYPQILPLVDGRLLLTFTVRALHPPLGLQAVLGTETARGFKFDFQRDRIVIDAKTPSDLPSGGGFGPTIQLPDETLVSVYSYRGADNKTHLESVRWKLPAD
ncbi:MAG TPA: sialidase family protein [Planctomycetaceae bacterium]|nr:sialidase family protein [Planctomycetaceae bacterium]